MLAAIIVSVAVWLLEGADGVPFDPVVIAVIVVGNGALGMCRGRRWSSRPLAASLVMWLDELKKLVVRRLLPRHPRQPTSSRASIR